MLHRKRRKGFWWYSWLLVLTIGGGVVGGYYGGLKMWEAAPKDYEATAVMRVEIRPVFTPTGAVELAAEEGLDLGGDNSVNELEALRYAQGSESLKPTIRELDLAAKWGLTESETLAELANSVDAELEVPEITISVIRSDPEEAALLANTVAKNAVDSLKRFDESLHTTAMKRLDAELAVVRGPVNLALEEAATALREAKVPITPTIDTDLQPYMEIPEVLNAAVDLTSAKERLEQVQRDQKKERIFFARPMASPEIIKEATPPAKHVGPPTEPFTQQGMLMGSIAGILGGLLLMFIFWKLFTPKAKGI